VIDLQNSFTAAKSTKFSTKPVLVYPPHLKYICCITLENLYKKFCTFHTSKTCFKCDFLSSIQQISAKYNKFKCKMSTICTDTCLEMIFTFLQNSASTHHARETNGLLQHEASDVIPPDLIYGHLTVST